MSDKTLSAYGALLLRVVLGALFLVHDGLKLFVFTPAGTAGFFAKLGLPGELAYLVMLVEGVGGIALILGFYPRLVALALCSVLLGTIVFVHAANGFFFSNPNGGWEYPAFWIIALVVLAMVGDGAFALRPTPLPGSSSSRLAR